MLCCVNAYILAYASVARQDDLLGSQRRAMFDACWVLCRVVFCLRVALFLRLPPVFHASKMCWALSERTWLGLPCFAIRLGLFWFLALALVGEHMPALFDTAGLPPDQRFRSLSQ